MEFLEKTRTPRKHTCDKCNSSDVQKLLSGFAVGRSKSTSQVCETCPTDFCQGGSCPGSMGI